MTQCIKCGSTISDEGSDVCEDCKANDSPLDDRME